THESLSPSLAHLIREPVPGHDVVPLRALLPFTTLILVTLVGGQAEFRHGHSARCVFDLRVLPQISHQDHFVYAFCHGSIVSFINFGKYISSLQFIKAMTVSFGSASIQSI